MRSDDDTMRKFVDAPLVLHRLHSLMLVGLHTGLLCYLLSNELVCYAVLCFLLVRSTQRGAICGVWQEHGLAAKQR